MKGLEDWKDWEDTGAEEMDTPLYELEYPNEEGNRIFIKRDDLLPFSLGGNKVRIGWEFYRDMCRVGCDCMVTYGDRRSNLCRVLGNICCREHVPCYMLCSDVEEGSGPSCNSRLMGWLGTEVIPCRKDAIAGAVEALLARLEGEGRRPYYIFGDQWGEGREGVPVQAYVDAYQEIMRQEAQLGIRFGYIFTPSGTGATQSGLAAGSLLAGDGRKVVGISVSRGRGRGTRIMVKAVRQYFRRRGLPAPEGLEDAICLEDGYLLGGYGKYDGRVQECIHRQFAQNALPLDPTYTGKAFWGMEQYLRRHGVAHSQILFLHTGGAPLFYDFLMA